MGKGEINPVKRQKLLVNLNRGCYRKCPFTVDFRCKRSLTFNICNVLLCQDKVFGAGYPSVPTMSQEEFLEKEILEGKVVLDYKE